MVVACFHVKGDEKRWLILNTILYRAILFASTSWMHVEIAH